MKNNKFYSAWLLPVCSLLLLTCSPSHQDLGNTFRWALIAKIKGFDPAQVSDLYSHICQKQVYQSLYQYHYLKRPYEVEPALADSMPQISEGGTLYTIRLKKGRYFSDDPAFKNGKGREVVAEDFIYSIKRLVDARTRTTGWWLFDGKVKGLGAYRDKTNKMPLDDKAFLEDEVEGLRALDRYTVQIRLTNPYPYFKYILTMGYTAVIAREVVEYYGEEFLNHPVGTGPYVLKEWRRGLKLVFERNPKYKGHYPLEGMPEDSAAGLLADAGKPLPFIDKLVLQVIVEDQPRWLNFIRGNLDLSAIPKDNYNDAVTPDKKLHEKFAAKGIVLTQSEELDLVYTMFNLEHPVLGNNKKLRQAMSLAKDVSTMIERFYNGRAIPAHSPIPPGLFGYDREFLSPYVDYNISKAKKLLSEAGFPGGKGLPVFEYTGLAHTTSRQMAEHFQQDMKAIGIKIKIIGLTWPEFLNKLKTKNYQIAGAAWAADYPDPENFLQLLYGPNEAPGENGANYKNPVYDSLYNQMAVMQDSPERLEIVKRMKEIVVEDCPWIFNTHRLRERLYYEWLGNFKPTSVDQGSFKYYKIHRDRRTNILANGN